MALLCRLSLSCYSCQETSIPLRDVYGLSLEFPFWFCCLLSLGVFPQFIMLLQSLECLLGPFISSFGLHLMLMVFASQIGSFYSLWLHGAWLYKWTFIYLASPSLVAITDAPQGVMLFMCHLVHVYQVFCRLHAKTYECVILTDNGKLSLWKYQPVFLLRILKLPCPWAYWWC